MPTILSEFQFEATLNLSVTFFGNLKVGFIHHKQNISLLIFLFRVIPLIHQRGNLAISSPHLYLYQTSAEHHMNERKNEERFTLAKTKNPYYKKFS